MEMKVLKRIAKEDVQRWFDNVRRMVEGGGRKRKREEGDGLCVINH